jgi:hypothetical protein
MLILTSLGIAAFFLLRVRRVKPRMAGPSQTPDDLAAALPAPSRHDSGYFRRGDP